MQKRKNPHELLWDLIRKHKNNRTAVAKKLGISRQLFNYYAHQTHELSDEFVRKVIYALHEDEFNLIDCSDNEIHLAGIKKINLSNALNIIEVHPAFIKAEKETHLPIRKIMEDILWRACI